MRNEFSKGNQKRRVKEREKYEEMLLSIWMMFIRYNNSRAITTTVLCFSITRRYVIHP